MEEVLKALSVLQPPLRSSHTVLADVDERMERKKSDLHSRKGKKNRSDAVPFSMPRPRQDHVNERCCVCALPAKTLNRLLMDPALIITDVIFSSRNLSGNPALWLWCSGQTDPFNKLVIKKKKLGTLCLVDRISGVSLSLPLNLVSLDISFSNNAPFSKDQAFVGGVRRKICLPLTHR